MAEVDIKDSSRRRTSKPGLISQQLNEIGKMPPQAVELEEAVLGALMLEKDALTNVIDILQLFQYFYTGSNFFYVRILYYLFCQFNS